RQYLPSRPRGEARTLRFRRAARHRRGVAGHARGFHFRAAQPRIPRTGRKRPVRSARGILRVLMRARFLEHLKTQLAELETAGLYKHERVIDSQQSAEIHVAGGPTVLNFCANNYLGLANHPAIMAAAKEAIDTHGYGMASVRFICGTQDVH